MGNNSKIRSALVVIDMQRGLFDGQSRPYNGTDVLLRVKALVAKARELKVLTVFVQHYGPKGSPLEQRAPAWELVDGLSAAEGDWVIQKMQPSIFFNTGLQEQLAEAGISRLILTGMKTEYCIDTSCRIGAELGFQVVLVSDAHTTTDSTVLSASTIIAHHNLTLSGPFAKLITSDQINFREV